MAGASKFPPGVIARFSSPPLLRKSSGRPPRRYYLIVCEGEATEPNYFNALKGKLPPDMLNCVTVVGEGKNTFSLVERAVELCASRKRSGKPPYHRIWLVFDRDSFKADNFDNAIRSAESKSVAGGCQWRCAWSNEAFELWYLLHFDQHFASLGRGGYQGKIERCLKPQGKRFKYMKNAKDMYQLLEPFQYVCDSERKAHVGCVSSWDATKPDEPGDQSSFVGGGAEKLHRQVRQLNFRRP